MRECKGKNIQETDEDDIVTQGQASDCCLYWEALQVTHGEWKSSLGITYLKKLHSYQVQISEGIDFLKFPGQKLLDLFLDC